MESEGFFKLLKSRGGGGGGGGQKINGRLLKLFWGEKSFWGAPSVAESQGGGGGTSLLGNENELIFRGYILPDQPEFFIIFIQAISVKTNSYD